MYKKKSLKFTYENVRRDARHAETLKARESSRFKRLSMLRCLDESGTSTNSNSTFNTPLEHEEHQKVKKQPMSRLEMLFKWKQEKEIKRELETKCKKKPFYVGKISTLNANKNVLSVKSSFINSSNTSFNTSKSVKSKLAVTPNPFQINKAGNAVKQIPQVSRVPNSSKQIPSRAAFQSSKIPNSKQISSAPKSVGTAQKGNNIPTFPKGPINTVSNSGASKINQISSVPKAGMKSYVKAPLKIVPNAGKGAQPNGLLKPKSQRMGSSQLKVLTKLPNKPVQKVGALSKPAFNKTPQRIPSKVGPLSKPAPNAASAFNRTPQKIPSKMPATGMTQKSTSVSKIQPKETNRLAQNVPTRKGFCFKTAVTNSLKQQKETPKIIPVSSATKKTDEKLNKGEKIKCPEVESDIIQDLTFNSDISIIKRPSFAPANFTFQPITSLPVFMFDDEDPCEILERVARKYMNRTSTPTKESERNSCSKSSKEPSSSNSTSMHLNKSSEMPSGKSTCNTVDVSNVISIKTSLMNKNSVHKENVDESVNEIYNTAANEDANNKQFNQDVSSVATENVDEQVHDKLPKGLCYKNGLVGDFHTNKDDKDDSCNVIPLNKSSETHPNQSTFNTLDVSNLISLNMSLRDERYIHEENGDKSIKQETSEVVANEDANKKQLNYDISDVTTTDASNAISIKTLMNVNSAHKENVDESVNEIYDVATSEDVDNKQFNQKVSSVATETNVYEQVHDKSLKSLCNKNDLAGDLHTNKDDEDDPCNVVLLNKSSETHSNQSTCNTLDVSNLISHKMSLRDESFIHEESGDQSINQETSKVANEKQLNYEIEDVGTESAHNKSPKISCYENAPVSDFHKNKDPKNDSSNGSLKMDISENEPSVPIKTEDFHDTLMKNVSVDFSLLDTSDVDKIGKMFEERLKLVQEEEAKKADIPEQAEAPTFVERKSSGSLLKRFSMLKSSSSLKSIVEISETDDYIPNTPLKSSREQENVFTPRRSKRLSSQSHSANLRDCGKIAIDSPVSSSSTTPRRSLRLRANSSTDPDVKNCPLLLPHEDKSILKVTPRRSMRLIDLNTPEKGENKRRSQLYMPADFDNLLDTENMDPNSFLVDFESPDVIPKSRSKKVSLLYTPDKRKSIRKSIRGDLMSFSPSS